MKEKVDYQVDKRRWKPSPLIGQIVLVTSLNQDGQSNVAPKSWVSMMAFEPSMLALGCNLEHWTAQNILRSHEYVINIPGEDLVEVVWQSHTMPHPRLVEDTGLTPIPAQEVKAPRIEECKAHLECRLDQQLTYGKEVIIIGKIVAASIDRQAIEAQDPYEYMRLIAFLEAGTYGVIEETRTISQGTGPGKRVAAHRLTKVSREEGCK